MINRRYELAAHLDSLTRCRAKLNFAAAKSTNFIDPESVEDELECARGASEGGSKKSSGAFGLNANRAGALRVEGGGGWGARES